MEEDNPTTILTGLKGEQIKAVKVEIILLVTRGHLVTHFQVIPNKLPTGRRKSHFKNRWQGVGDLAQW